MRATMNSILTKIILLTIPLLLTPLWVFLIAEGIVTLGGGDKDLLVLIPYLFWSLLYLVSGIIFWKHSLRRMILSSILYSMVIMLTLWLGLLVYSFTA
jgi:hypothetical protein